MGKDKTAKYIPITAGRPVVWSNVVYLALWHVIALIGLVMLPSVAWRTMLFNFLYASSGSIGVTAGAHRLWTHRTYKGVWPLRFWLMLNYSTTMPQSIYAWARDHRAHHKFSDTDADPHDARRGFFYSHVGWLMLRKDTPVLRGGLTLDLSDLERDWVVRLHRRYHLRMAILLIVVLPTLVPFIFWQEPLIKALCFTAFRHCFVLHGVWAINSWTHLYGTRPYDKTILAADNRWVENVWRGGEGYHNFHHSFPSDYRASELSGSRINHCTLFIDACALVGLAYDLKTTSTEVVINKIQRSGVDPCASQ